MGTKQTLDGEDNAIGSSPYVSSCVGSRVFVVVAVAQAVTLPTDLMCDTSLARPAQQPLNHEFTRHFNVYPAPYPEDTWDTRGR